MSYQIIPSYELDKGEGRGFFKFGSSGHVKEFAGKVVQHEKLFDVVSSYKGWSKKILKTLGLLEIARDLNQIRISWLSKYARKYGTLGRNLYIEGLYECFKNNDKQLFEELKKRETNFSGSDKQDLNSFAESVFEYQNFQDFSNAIPLCWYPFPAPGNYGDWLSPYVLSRVTGRSVKFIPFKQLSSFKQKNLLFIGSIIKFANDCSVVFGSGASRTNTKINTKAKYVSVRGDLTKRLLLQSGITLPNDFSVGDPAIVLPLIYPSKRSKNGRLALVRHFSHRGLQLELPEGVDEISILRSSAQDIEEFIDILNTYSGVLTSAMHCYITCQAYGIPCAFVSWQAGEGKIAGDGMKYSDYATGADMPPIVTHNLPQNMKGEVDLYSLLSFNKINNDKIIDVYNKIKELSQLFDSNAL